jgi:hypothetical protein
MSRRRISRIVRFTAKNAESIYRLAGQSAPHPPNLGAVRAALAGHVAAAHPGLRALIESALYALLMMKKPELVDVLAAPAGK